jgi:hypothetical protein
VGLFDGAVMAPTAGHAPNLKLLVSCVVSMPPEKLRACQHQKTFENNRISFAQPNTMPNYRHGVFF